MALINLGMDYCEQSLWIVHNLSNGKGMVVIADCKREALSHAEHYLGTGAYKATLSQCVSGTVVVGDNFKES